MPEVNSYPDITDDWEGLLGAAEKNPDLLPVIEAERQALKETLTEFQGLRRRQEELGALRQAVTQQLKEAVARGRDLAMRIRSLARGKIGPKSELLVHWRMIPIRKRARKTAPVVKPPDGEVPGTSAGASTSPSTKPVV
ncbi:MAG TPA: hypothetical protein VHC97_25480 [Thermoanaerobaculia bacterium]|jgi:hypothetical protein|nr:hypothetical protein [Thermoanaerobaculia bacterium]